MRGIHDGLNEGCRVDFSGKLIYDCCIQGVNSLIMLEYKVVELSTVTDEELETAINEKVKESWNLDGINFAMSQSSKRPAMAFILFTRETEE